MKLWALGDLHFGEKVDKPMDIFGDNWAGHTAKIIENWKNTINEEDLVLIPGDISWATKFEDAAVDLEIIDNLPGKKIIMRGNHDYWWQSLAKMKDLYESIDFLHNNYYTYGDVAICGTRGWTCPGVNDFKEDDLKIYKREVNRLKLSLGEAQKNGYNKYIVMLHFPPTNDKLEESGFIEVIKEFGVKTVIYGHLHSYGANDYRLKGIQDEIEYHLVSADFIQFTPRLILE